MYAFFHCESAARTEKKEREKREKKKKEKHGAKSEPEMQDGLSSLEMEREPTIDSAYCFLLFAASQYAAPHREKGEKGENGRLGKEWRQRVLACFGSKIGAAYICIFSVPQPRGKLVALIQMAA